MTAAVGTYVYAVVRAPRAPAVPRGLRGLPGTGPVRSLPVADTLWLLVADAPLGRYGADAIERGLRDLDWVAACAGGHETVVERFAGTEALAPMKLFTIFETDERAAASVRTDLGRIVRALDRVAGRQEWGVRVLLDERRALARARARAPRPAKRTRGMGATFLARKKAERDAARALVAEGRRAMTAVFRDLARHADNARRRGPTQAEAGSRMLLDAAFLVPVGAVARFKAAVRRVTRDIARRGYDLTVTGPWPPYSFVAEAE